MRYFKLDMGTTCVNLGSALQSLGVTMAVPATSFTLCNLVVTRVPAVTGTWLHGKQSGYEGYRNRVVE